MADRALGNPLGNPLGLARAGSSPPLAQIVDITSGAGEYVVPAGYRFMQVTAVGGGSAGSYQNATIKGGSGGAVARTKLIPLNGKSLTISYVVGAGGTPALNNITPGGDTTVRFLGYVMVAGGGTRNPPFGDQLAVGGTASGGDYNFTGGSAGGGGRLAGGAAGLFGNAYEAGSGSGGQALQDGGGGGGVGGGGGLGVSIITGNTEIELGRSPAPSTVVPSFPGSAGGDSVGSVAGKGGAWGGGGGGSESATLAYLGAGGHGGVRIELW